ncbi:MAG: hypothetical protein Q9O74_08950 [Planctomycetota bacterium]|nr:hypothetical protein [Planctomycetota bacterium]
MAETDDKYEYLLSIAKATRFGLNHQGLAFQCRALVEVEEARKERRSYWHLAATELPVAVTHGNTHVDFVLDNRIIPWFLVVECKRVDPKSSRWVFAKYPTTSSSSNHVGLHTSLVSVSDLPGTGSHVEQWRTWASLPHLYNTAFAISSPSRGQQAGDHAPSGGKDRDAPVKAAQQAIKGMNGLINHWHRFGVERSGTRFVLPVVVTTAELWGCDIDLSSADLATGNVQVAPEHLTKHDWLCLEQNVSTSFLHDAPVMIPDGGLGVESEALFTCSCLIVNANSFGKFLGFLNEDTWLDTGPRNQSRQAGRWSHTGERYDQRDE